MRKIEELLIRKKTYEEIALFLGVSIGWVSENMSRAVPKKELRESSTFRELIQSADTTSSNYTLRDLDYIKEYDSGYFKELLRNDYLNDDKIPSGKLITS